MLRLIPAHEEGERGRLWVCWRVREKTRRREGERREIKTADSTEEKASTMFLQTVSILFLLGVLFGCSEGKGVQMQRDVQCCMRYSHGKVRTKDVLRYERQTEGPDCSIRAIMQREGFEPVFTSSSCLYRGRLYTKKAVKCADPRDRKVKRLLRKLNQRLAVKARRTMWLHPHMNLPVMSEVAVVNSQKMNKTK
ncbi:hypothetical protein DNTS_015160 [Danionella cerebrum]|uniref:Chemokine interleukin-8-like domain-containing protein n=1 Tax=Danionella cerebrum TaxID=2873325 RepID=A0A553RGW1_9TELE|nr:hypothetical protein DNTS_015160 [Danionella translucida]